MFKHAPFLRLSIVRFSFVTAFWASDGPDERSKAQKMGEDCMCCIRFAKRDMTIYGPYLIGLSVSSVSVYPPGPITVQ